VGNRLSLADVALVAYTRFAHQAELDLANWPHVQAWVRRIDDDLKIEHAG
jgi:glutathione S-transferase